MSTFNYDQMVRHEALAKKALAEENWALGYHHICQEAMFALLLVKTSDNNAGPRYMKKARGLLDLAHQLKAKLGKEKPATADANGAGKPLDESTLFQSVETPNMKFADVAGMDDVKNKFTEMVIQPLAHPELAKRFGVRRGGGVLLYGPPGTGKTFVARALAGELNARFYVIKSSDLISKFVGETEERIKQLFEEVRKNPVSVIFFDEIDALSPDRTKEDIREYDHKMVDALLQEIDGFNSKESGNVLLLLGATNRPYSMDSAFLRSGRMTVKIRVGLPDLDCRQKILELFFKTRDLTVPEEVFHDAAVRTEGYNSADVNNLAETVVSLAFQAAIEFSQTHSDKDNYIPDFKQLFEEAFKTAKSSVSQRDLELLAKWEKENGIA